MPQDFRVHKKLCIDRTSAAFHSYCLSFQELLLPLIWGRQNESLRFWSLVWISHSPPFQNSLATSKADPWLYLDNDRTHDWKWQFSDQLCYTLEPMTSPQPCITIPVLHLTWLSYLIVQLLPWPRLLLPAWCLSLITHADHHWHTELGKSSIRKKKNLPGCSCHNTLSKPPSMQSDIQVNHWQS